ncbi:helix-turn-helix domain-containing protein [Ligilactobacillus ceti]|uniref:Helicase Helix-turn-helix domain-containing protein n=1 Tax=Ligilactobacillus ceti DSM 22408 TaxID=1122146 RepID=A0A0R2KHP4_9LACO|nr:helix-turn-helix domain-containing protein [Ligilactobacillus ceti]KRN88889.1 hypothetical protein IV53_GL000859 [Ligilactobacillus ceti DSM 22408]
MHQPWILYFEPEKLKKASVLRQLMTNKITSSSLFWGFYYDWLGYINEEPKLQESIFLKELAQLVKLGDLMMPQQGFYQLTPQGEQKKQAMIEAGLYLHKPQLLAQIDYPLWKDVFYLSVQAASEYAYDQKRYYVITSNLQAQYYVKQWIKKYSLAQLVTELNETLNKFLAQEDPQLAAAFSASLVGYQVNGKTALQIAEMTPYSPAEISLMQVDFLLRYAQYIVQEQSILKELVAWTKNERRVPQSALVTYQMYLQGFDIATISQRRHVKPATVEEHLIDVAIIKRDFPRDAFLTPELKTALSQMMSIQNVATIQYKELKEKLPELTFLQFRMFQIDLLRKERNN